MTSPDKVVATTILDYQTRVEHLLHQHLKQPPEVATLNAAMRYSVLNTGKRLRPLLVYTTADALNLTIESVDAAACAVELIHCYSLIHDDLPAMDDDDLRRGQPSCHCAFGEATAILAGDAMQSLAFAILASPTPSLKASQQLTMCQHLADACGVAGMAGGQAMDLEATGSTITAETLTTMHQRKTGALLAACVELACLAASPTEAQHHALSQFGYHFGLAFQIQDDILDIESSTDTLGKPQHSDSQGGKATYPGMIGITAAKQARDSHFSQAITHIQTTFPNSLLHELTVATMNRDF